MAQVTLEAQRRTTTGKGVARTLRRTGQVPAVIYGHHRAPETLTLDAKALSRLLAGISAGSTILDVAVDGGAPVKALIRELQRNPLKQTDILHVDLYEVSATEKVTLEVNIKLTGTSDGVRNFGGVLDQVMHKLQIRVLPANIPAVIEVDVTPLAIGKSFYVRDLKLPNVEIMNDVNQPICSVVAPRAEETATPGADAAASSEPELIRKPKAEDEAAAKE